MFSPECDYHAGDYMFLYVGTSVSRVLHGKVEMQMYTPGYTCWSCNEVGEGSCG